MTYLNDIVAAMTGGGTLNVQFDPRLNGKAPGRLEVFLSAGDLPDSVKVGVEGPGESANILWLPWKQGELQTLQPDSVERVPPGTLFLTYVLSGCKLFAIRGGPVWHIDAPVEVGEFWPRILDDDWVKDFWSVGTAQDVAYLHRAGQQPELWDLTGLLQGGAETTYGADNLGDARVGGIVVEGQQGKYLDLYVRTSPWASLSYAEGRRKK